MTRRSKKTWIAAIVLWVALMAVQLVPSILKRDTTVSANAGDLQAAPIAYIAPDEPQIAINLDAMRQAPPTATSTTTNTPAAPTATSTSTATATNTATNTATATDTPTNTPEPPTATATDTPTNTPEPPTATATNTATSTATNTATSTATNTATSTATNTATSTATNTATSTATNTATSTATDVPPPAATATQTPVPYEGCSVSFWLDNRQYWAAAGYPRYRSLERVFDVPDIIGLDLFTLRQALRFRGSSTINGASQIVLRSGVAAVLNASHPEIAFPRSAEDVIADVNEAMATSNRTIMLTLATELDADNNRGCPLGED